MVRSYVKIYGPPILEAIKHLEGVAVELSKAISIRFRHSCLPQGYPGHIEPNTRDWAHYIEHMQRTYVDCYEPVKLISESQQMLGEHDFFFEWVEDPSMKKIENLIEKIDEALSDTGCRYTITTK
jgi:hypothetical protein